MDMIPSVALIGFGEAGRTFAESAGWRGDARVYDIATDDPRLSCEKAGDYAAAGVAGCSALATALAAAPVVLSLVTADQALVAARSAARHLPSKALYLDMNSVAPDTKRAAATIIEAAQGRYVDVAVMAPVQPTEMATPLLVSGPHAEAGAAALAALGFKVVRVVPGLIGRASSIKMIRSVMIKGLEALTAECLLAADAAGVVEEVAGSLGAGWADKADYNLDRMLVHGRRRAEEMEEVVKTLATLGIDPVMSRGAIHRQRALGNLRLASPVGLPAKLALLARTPKGNVA